MVDLGCAPWNLFGWECQRLPRAARPAARSGRRLLALRQVGGQRLQKLQGKLLICFAQRRAAWKAPAPRYTRGVQAKFAFNASSASKGAVLDNY